MISLDLGQLLTHCTSMKLKVYLTQHKPNLKTTIVNQIQQNLGIPFQPKRTNNHDDTYFAPINLFDYIYGILHHPKYRIQYKDLLNIDFTQIPYPKNKDLFWKFANCGQ